MQTPCNACRALGGASCPCGSSGCARRKTGTASLGKITREATPLRRADFAPVRGVAPMWSAAAHSEPESEAGATGFARREVADRRNDSVEQFRLWLRLLFQPRHP